MRHYPGKAVDVSLSLEQKSAMGVLYEANWLNAHETIKSNKSKIIPYHQQREYINGISALGKYQRTLEKVKEIEEQQKDATITKTIRELNGYKPSTIRRKHRKQYSEWDERQINEHFKQNSNNISNNNNIYIDDKIKSDSRVKESQTAEYNTYINLSGSGKERNQKNEKGRLKRSQTVIVDQPSSTTASKASSRGTLDIRDIFQWRQKFKTQQSKETNQNKILNSNINNNHTNSNGTDKSRTRTFNLIKSINDYEVIDFDDDSGYKSNTHDYETIEYKNRKSDIDRIEENNISLHKPEITNGIKINRVKSVRIQSNDENFNSKEPPQSPPPPPPITKSNLKKSDSTSGIKKFIYNTISAGTRYPKELLKHINGSANSINSSNSTETKSSSNSNEKLTHSNSRQTTYNTKSPTSSTNSSPQTTPIQESLQSVFALNGSSSSGGGVGIRNGNISVTQIQQQNDVLRKPGSSSSLDSSDEMFSIPRPRLIVPVHTYARKRRTGNLNADKIDPLYDDEIDTNNSGNDKGKYIYFVLILIKNWNL